MDKNKIYTGSCLCGAIHYQICGEIGPIIQCHCQRCRKANGTAFATNAPVAKAAFQWTQGEAYLKKFKSTATTERCFCRECGSPLISIKAHDPDVYRLRIGSLDTPLTEKPTQHIFVASKAQWDEIHDDLPQYETFPNQ
ncbi:MULTISPECIES: GFA family protein [unclassified Acinetobacter]|uniref:GFA family protein n=1 Tax=unclassified Acinetobacter TaxID=196816 RepID=UPI002934A199|nr:MULTISPECIES: GFA family protein [unclassified Acinetobacter]WOE30577.1 GFA family protein [Acinetobacter sp. SAAs470]WOE38769.1 GFA family protein [Acinetobacter sp. SAAs474]